MQLGKSQRHRGCLIWRCRVSSQSLFKTRIKPSYSDSGHKTEANVLHMSAKKKPPSNLVLAAKQAPRPLPSSKVGFFKAGFCVGLSHISVSSVHCFLCFYKADWREVTFVRRRGEKTLTNPVCLTEKNSAPLIFQRVKIPHLVFSAVSSAIHLWRKDTVD